MRRAAWKLCIQASAAAPMLMRTPALLTCVVGHQTRAGLTLSGPSRVLRHPQAPTKRATTHRLVTRPRHDRNQRCPCYQRQLLGRVRGVTAQIALMTTHGWCCLTSHLQHPPRSPRRRARGLRRLPPRRIGVVATTAATHAPVLHQAIAQQATAMRLTLGPPLPEATWETNIQALPVGPMRHLRNVPQLRATGEEVV